MRIANTGRSEENWFSFNVKWHLLSKTIRFLIEKWIIEEVILASEIKLANPETVELIEDKLPKKGYIILRSWTIQEKNNSTQSYY